MEKKTGDFIEWTDELSVGIEEIDEQHKVLVKLVNQMHDAIADRKGSDAVIGILNALTEYTKIHFVVEESLMRILNFPGYDEHKKVHDELVEHVVELHEKVASGRTAISFELMYFLRAWLSKHIMEEDRQYSTFFLDAGLQPKLKKKSWIDKLWGH